MQTTYRVQWRSTEGVWHSVNSIEYTSRRTAMLKLMEEVKNDPEYTHRLVKQMWEEDTIILADEGDDS